MAACCMFPGLEFLWSLQQHSLQYLSNPRPQVACPLYCTSSFACYPSFSCMPCFTTQSCLSVVGCEPCLRSCSLLYVTTWAGLDLSTSVTGSIRLANHNLHRRVPLMLDAKSASECRCSRLKLACLQEVGSSVLDQLCVVCLGAELALLWHVLGATCIALHVIHMW
jgi:hypothetical protein